MVGTKLREFVLALVCGCVLSSGCLRTSTPIRTVEYPAHQERQSDTLIIMLPGLGDKPEDYANYGLLDSLRAAQLGADVIAVDAHAGYYRTRELIPRIEEDVLKPAKSAGYEKIWLVGISLGGLGVLLSAQQFETSVDGIVLMSPYLGSRRTLREITDAGGPQSWTPPPEGSATYSTELWSWIKPFTVAPEEHPPLYLAYGDDEPAEKFQVLARALPERRVVVVPGGHTWTTWQAAWRELLARDAAR